MVTGFVLVTTRGVTQVLSQRQKNRLVHKRPVLEHAGKWNDTYMCKLRYDGCMRRIVRAKTSRKLNAKIGEILIDCKYLIGVFKIGI